MVERTIIIKTKHFSLSRVRVVLQLLLTKKRHHTRTLLPFLSRRVLKLLSENRLFQNNMNHLMLPRLIINAIQSSTWSCITRNKIIWTKLLKLKTITLMTGSSSCILAEFLEEKISTNDAILWIRRKKIGSHSVMIKVIHRGNINACINRNHLDLCNEKM